MATYMGGTVSASLLKIIIVVAVSFIIRDFLVKETIETDDEGEQTIKRSLAWG